MNKNKRFEKRVKGNPGIARILYWNEETKIYVPPKTGCAYVATRKRLENMILKKERQSFPTLDLARQWRSTFESKESLYSDSEYFKEIVGKYLKTKMPTLRESTQDSYRRILEKYIYPFNDYKILDISPIVVDSWIEFLKSKIQRQTRRSFSHELDVLSGIFSFYKEYNDSFISPILPRHKRAIKVTNKVAQKANDLTREEFFRFRDSLKEGKHGRSMYVLATIQFFQALRISEVAALCLEDIRWDPNLENSRLRIQSSVFYPRKKNGLPQIQESYKNGAKTGGVKEQPLRAETAMALRNGFKSR